MTFTRVALRGLFRTGAALGLAWVVLACGAAPGGSWAAEAGPGTESVRLLVFVRDGCRHCTAAKAWLADLATHRPHVQVVYRAVDQDPEARAELAERSRRAGHWPPGVPSFAVDDRLIVGFDTPERSGPLVLALIDASESARQDSVEMPVFGTLSAQRLGLPLFTLALGLLDGFNPCAMWVLLFLLSLLIHLKDRKRMVLIAATFVLVSGAVYYAFMAAWLNLFLAVGLAQPLRIALGTVALLFGAVNVKDFVAFGRGPSLSIPERVKPGLYARARNVLRAPTPAAALLGVALLAVLVNFVELLCTAGLPAIYTAVLTQHQLTPAAHYAYLGLYILGYVADDSVMVGTAVATLSSRKLSERAGRWLKLLGGMVMLALGAVLLLRPGWLM